MKISPEQIDQSLLAEINTEEVVGLVEEKQEETDSILPSRCDDSLANERIDTGLDMNRIIDNLDLLRYRGRDGTEKVVRAFARLVIELEKRIPFYDTIISDDAAGRLVSLFLREVINKKKAELDEKSIQTVFIANINKSQENDSAMNDFLSKNKDLFGRVLLVTEHIESGSTMKSIVDKLNRQGIEFDAAALSVTPGNFFIDNDDTLLSNLKKKLTYGEQGISGCIFVRKPFLGVVKDKSMDVIHPIKDEDFDGDSVKKVRQEIKFLADEISKLI